MLYDRNAERDDKLTNPKTIAAKFGISASTIRNYEHKGIIPPAERSRSGYRKYTDLHVSYLACIQAMAPSFGMETTIEALRCLNQNKPLEAMWLIRRREVALYETKERAETLIQDIRDFAATPSAEKLFTIHEVSRLVQVPRSTIRYWEQAGYVIADRDLDNAYRRYSEYHLLKIRLIHTLQGSVYSEENVRFRHSIAEVEHSDLQGLLNVAESITAYLDRIIEAQFHGIAYWHRLIQVKAGTI